MNNDHADIVKRLIAECLLITPEEIDVQDAITHLRNIDSLTFEMLIFAFENETQQAMLPEDIMPLKTVADLVDLYGVLIGRNA